MSRTKLFLYNSFATAFYQIIVFIAGFITPRYMLIYYGSETNGLVTSITQFISYFYLIEAGLATAAMFSLYKPLSDKNFKEVSGILVAIKRYYYQMGYFFISVIFVIAIIYPFFVRTEVADPFFVGLLVFAIGLAGAMEFFLMAKYRVLLEADQKTYVLAFANTLSIVCNTAIVVLMARSGLNIVLLKYIAILAVLSRSVVLYLYVKIKYKYINYSATPIYAALSKRWDALYMQIMNSAYLGAPIIIATLFLNLTSVSIYAVYSIVTQGLHSAFYVITTGVTSSFGALISTREIETLKRSYSVFQYVFFSIITVAYSVTFVAYLPFIKLYTTGVTDVNYLLPIFSILFAVRGLLQTIKTPLRMLIMASGLYRETRIQATLETSIAILGGIVLAPIWGLPGILIGSIIADLYRCIHLMIFVPRKITYENVSVYVWRIVRIILVIGIVFSLSKCVNYDPSNYVNWTIFSFVVGLITVAFVAIIGLIFEKESFNETIKRLRLIPSLFKRSS